MSTAVASWQRLLAAHWAVLHAREAVNGIATSALPIALDRGTPLVGVDRRGDHHLLVPMTGGAQVLDDAQAAHIRIQASELVFDGATRSFVDVACHRADLAGLFDDVLAEILTRLESTPADRPDVVCAQVLAQWRELLRRRGGAMSDSAVRGLLGELIILERLLACGGTTDGDVWTGPDREPVDFRMSAGDLEVKTLGPTGAEVEIHGIEQLETQAGRALHLVLVRLAATRDVSGITLPELVARVRDRIAAPDAFTLRLAKAGYLDADADHYRDLRFAVGPVLALRVEDGFPRITRQSLTTGLPEEVTHLTYGLDLATHLPDALTEERLDPLFTRGDTGS